jgi:hypothetical protein
MTLLKPKKLKHLTHQNSYICVLRPKSASFFARVEVSGRGAAEAWKQATKGTLWQRCTLNFLGDRTNHKAKDGYVGFVSNLLNRGRHGQRPKKRYFSSACEYVKLPVSIRVPKKVFSVLFLFRSRSCVFPFWEIHYKFAIREKSHKVLSNLTLVLINFKFKFILFLPRQTIIFDISPGNCLPI